MHIKNCEQCDREFEKPYTCGMPEWTRRKFCSRKCADQAKKGVLPEWLEEHAFVKGKQNNPNGGFTKGQTAWNKGKKMPFSKETREKLAQTARRTIANETPEQRRSRTQKALKTKKSREKYNPNQPKGKNHPDWRGNKANYHNIHKWVNKHWKRKGVCELCSEERYTHWSNKDHKYVRVKTDWQELCASCHRKYDIAHGLRL